MTPEQFEEWFIPLYERYVKEHTSEQRFFTW